MAAGFTYMMASDNNKYHVIEYRYNVIDINIGNPMETNIKYFNSPKLKMIAQDSMG